MISTAIYLLASLILSYAGFCRLVRTDTGTVLCIRVAFWLLTMGAVISVAAVVVWGYRPGWPSALLATCMTFVQLATAVLWQHGVPVSYRGDAQPAKK